MKFLAAILALSLGLGGCSFLEERPQTSRLIVQAATLKVIDRDAERKERVVEIVGEVSEFVSSDEGVTVDAVVDAIRAEIRWERLDDAEVLLVQALLIELELRLEEYLGENPLPEDLRLTAETVAGWVLEAATLAVVES